MQVSIICKDFHINTDYIRLPNFQSINFKLHSDFRILFRLPDTSTFNRISLYIQTSRYSPDFRILPHMLHDFWIPNYKTSLSRLPDISL